MPVRFSAVSHEDRHVATAAVRDAFHAASATITDVTFFSGVQTVVTFEVARRHLRALGDALDRVVTLSAATHREMATLSEFPEDDDIGGTFVLMFAEGDPDLEREVPKVPG